MKEKRKHTRLRIRFPLFCYCLTSKASFFSAFEDISIGGMCLIGNGYLTLNERMEFKIKFPGRTVSCKGTIVWNKELRDSKDMKAGVEFTNLGSKNQKYIDEFISERKPRAATRKI